MPSPRHAAQESDQKAAESEAEAEAEAEADGEAEAEAEAEACGGESIASGQGEDDDGGDL